jgi:hypothetical protein
MFARRPRSGAARHHSPSEATTHVMPIVTTWRDIGAARRIIDRRGAEVQYWRDRCDLLAQQLANLERAGAQVIGERDRLAADNARLRQRLNLWVGDLNEIDRALAALQRPRGGGGG